jgi:hypothetical protein
VVRLLTVPPPHPADTDKLVRQHPASDIQRALELRPVLRKVGRRKDIVPPLLGRLGLEARRAKVAPALPGQEAERHHAFRSVLAVAAVARDKIR